MHIVDRYVEVCGLSVSVVTAAPLVVEIEDVSFKVTKIVCCHSG